MRAINLSALTLVALAAPALSATCYRPNAAGGEIPFKCVRGEELKTDAPGLGGESDISLHQSVRDQRELGGVD